MYVCVCVSVVVYQNSIWSYIRSLYGIEGNNLPDPQGPMQFLLKSMQLVL